MSGQLHVYTLKGLEADTSVYSSAPELPLVTRMSYRPHLQSPPAALAHTPTGTRGVLLDREE